MIKRKLPVYPKHHSASSRVQIREGVGTSNSHPVSLLVTQVLLALRTHSKQCAKRVKLSTEAGSLL